MKVDNDLVEEIRAARHKLATDGQVRVRSAGEPDGSWGHFSACKTNSSGPN